MKERSPVLNLACAYKLASQQQQQDSQKNGNENSQLLTLIDDRFEEHISYWSSSSMNKLIESFPSPVMKQICQTNYSPKEVEKTETLMHNAAVDALKDIYPDQDHSLIESILNENNYVVETANWLTEVFGVNDKTIRAEEEAFLADLIKTPAPAFLTSTNLSQSDTENRDPNYFRNSLGPGLDNDDNNINDVSDFLSYWETATPPFEVLKGALIDYSTQSPQSMRQTTDTLGLVPKQILFQLTTYSRVILDKHTVVTK